MAAQFSKIESFIQKSGATLYDKTTLWREYQLGEYSFGVYLNYKKVGKPFTCSHYTVSKKGNLPHQTLFINNSNEFKSKIKSVIG